MTASTDLTKLTVNLVPSAVASLNAAANRCGDTRTDTVNRALALYDMVTELAARGRGTVAVVSDLLGDGEQREIRVSRLGLIGSFLHSRRMRKERTRA